MFPLALALFSVHELGFVRALWSPIHMGFVLRIQMRMYYDDWQLEENGEMLPVSVLEGTGWLLEEMCCISIANLYGLGRVGSFLSQCLSFSNRSV